MELDDLAVVAGADADERRAACDQRSLTGELASLIDVDHDLAVGRGPENLDRSVPNDKKTRLPVTRLDEDLAGRHASRTAIRLDTLDLRRSQRWEDAIDLLGRFND